MSELPGEGLGRENVVAAARGDGASGHTFIFCGCLVLREGDAAVGLNFGESRSSVGARSRQDDANGAIACSSASGRTKLSMDM